MTTTKLVSIVSPVMNEEEVLPLFHRELCRILDPHTRYRFEFVFVDDGSTDDTVGVLAKLRAADPRVRYVVLSRNFGHQSAVCAGLSYAVGDAVVTMDSDLQHPPELIPVLLAQQELGFDVVNTRREASAGAGWAKTALSAGFYHVFNRAATIRIEPGGADFRLMSRQVVDALNALPEVRRFLRGLVPWLGFRQAVVPFVAPPRAAGRAKFTFTRSLRLALEGITGFTFFPLRKVALFGTVVAMAAFVYAIAAVVIHLTGGATVPGWTSLLACVLFLGGVQLITLGVIGEYVGRILEEVKGRPGWVVRDVVGEPPADRPASLPCKRVG